MNFEKIVEKSNLDVTGFRFKKKVSQKIVLYPEVYPNSLATEGSPYVNYGIKLVLELENIQFIIDFAHVINNNDQKQKVINTLAIEKISWDKQIEFGRDIVLTLSYTRFNLFEEIESETIKVPFLHHFIDSIEVFSSDETIADEAEDETFSDLEPSTIFCQYNVDEECSRDLEAILHNDEKRRKKDSWEPQITSDEVYKYLSEQLGYPDKIIISAFIKAEYVVNSNYGMIMISKYPIAAGVDVILSVELGKDMIRVK